MKSVVNIIFVASTVLALLLESKVNAAFMFNQTVVKNEFGQAPSLIYDGGKINIHCLGEPSAELVYNVNGSFGLNVYQEMNVDQPNPRFTVQINSNTALDSYYCKDYGLTGKLSATKVDIFYRICDTCSACLQPTCGKDFMFSYFNKENQEKCTLLDMLNPGNINDIGGYDDNVHMAVVCIYGETTPQKSLFQALSKKRNLSFVASVSPYYQVFKKPTSPEEVGNVCYLKFQLTDNNTKPISMGSAILHKKGTYFTLECYGTIAYSCYEYENSRYLKMEKVVCGKPFKMEGYSSLSNVVTYLFCHGHTPEINVSYVDGGTTKSAEVERFSVKSYIHLVHMESDHYFFESKVRPEDQPEKKKLVCGFTKPSTDKRFIVTVNLLVSGVISKSVVGNDAEFAVDEKGDYECMLIVKFKSCYMQAEFTQNVTSKLGKYADSTTQSLPKYDDATTQSGGVGRFFSVDMLLILFAVGLCKF